MIIWHTEKMQNIWQMSMVHRRQGQLGWCKLFSSPDAAADILDSADNGSEYS